MNFHPEVSSSQAQLQRKFVSFSFSINKLNKVVEAFFSCVQNKLIFFSPKLKFQRKVENGRDDSTTFQCKARNQLFVLDSSKNIFRYYPITFWQMSMFSKAGGKTNKT